LWQAPLDVVLVKRAKNGRISLPISLGSGTRGGPLATVALVHAEISTLGVDVLEGMSWIGLRDRLCGLSSSRGVDVVQAAVVASDAETHEAAEGGDEVE
jgi:hypothetical protein